MNNTDTQKTLRDVELISYDDFYSQKREPNRVLNYEINEDGDVSIVLTWVFVSSYGFGGYQYMDEKGEGFKFNKEVQQPIIAKRDTSYDGVRITLPGSLAFENRDYNSPIYVMVDTQKGLDSITQDILQFEQEINSETKEVKVEIDGFILDDDE
ncbi:MAG: hypothetical protein Q8Q23_02390 [bacterium]|nr:hypothetical protein [bacterium]